jgi:O-antigen ligase
MAELLVSRLRSRSEAERPTIAAIGGGLVVPIGCFGLVTALSASNGGYFPTSWGWSALLLSMVAALALILRSDVHVEARSVGWVGAWAALAAWVAASIGWSDVQPQSVLEVQRILVYVAAAAAVVALARAELVGRLLAGTFAAIAAVATYSLATRLFPDRLGVFDAAAGYRLATPVGYWNGLGILCAIGVLLALGFVSSAASPAARAAAGAALVVLATTQYFTFSRGAWIALGAGAAAMLAVSPRRLLLATALIVTLPFAAGAVWLASRADSLTTVGASLGQATDEGHRLALAVGGLAAGAAATAAVFALVAPRLRVRRALRMAYGTVLVLAGVAALAVVFARYGGPVTLADKAWTSFKAPPAPQQGNLNERLFSFSGNGRVDLWRAAWADARAHDWLGSGSGSYEPWWYEHRTSGLNVRDAHSLYLETLAELGPPGLALLAIALGIPLLAVVRARRHPYCMAAFGAYAAWLVHAGVDWDWELTGVTLAALLCGGALVVAASSEVEPFLRASALRATGLALAAVVAGLAFVGLGGNIQLARSAEAAEEGRWVASERSARTALRWAPWSAEGWGRVAEAQIGRGDLDAARASLVRALEKDPRDWRLWTTLAEVAKSRRALARAEELNPLAPEVADARRSIGGGR